MAANFITAVNNLRVALKLTKQYREGDYDHAAIPVFALGLQVSESDLQQAAKLFNDQAQTELCFKDAEMIEGGYFAAVPMSWNLHEQSAPDAFPYGFVGIASTDWEETGAVLVFYKFKDDNGHPIKDQPIPVVAFVIAAEDVGGVLIDLRQVESHIDDVKKAYSIG
ncbi:hypothetical protein E8E13_002599 [Curvularia kusanoi]|uniref:Uncharacterized protein n=1 Tax=Curvularia kusanoi TaxID=90978 RepID=A0A9P4TC63_CURKU|nr:hypothetical protein E8E13_002599 [Curvularia kusanoi]